MTPTRARGFAVLALCVPVALTACGEAEDTAPLASGAGAIPDTSETFTQRIYERSFVFASVDGDSAFIVPWIMETVEEPDSVTREARGWVARGGVWDAFYAERWHTRPSRAAARVVPHNGLQLLVGDGDAIDGILFERGARSLEIILGDVAASWTGPRGGSFTVLSGSSFLADQRIDGMVLDMARASGGAQAPGGDWAFLLSGESAQFVITADREHGGEIEALYRGWGHVEETELQWPELRVDWARTEAFPPARRDIPVQWRISSSDGSVEGELQAVSAEIQAGEGPGPLLPVRALFEVSGTISTPARAFSVRGLLVHERR